MMTETELKLRIAPRDVPRLQRHPLLRELARGPAAIQKLYSIYYDTPARELWRNGIALRLRRVGRGWVQTLKFGGGAAAGLHQRQELEAPVARQQLDFTKLVAPGVTTLFDRPEVRDALAPAFATRVRRVVRMLETAAGERIEFSLDRGEIVAGGAREPLCEVELELKAGNPVGLFRIARRLAEDCAAKAEHSSKAERGFALLIGRGPVKAAPAEFAPDAAAGTAFAAVVSACLDHLQANERGVLEGADAEYLHQMRVALRRLRSALRVFAPLAAGEAAAALGAELKWLTGKRGPARDWDVFALETLPGLVAEFPDHAGLQELAAGAAARRRAANRAARAALASSRYQALLLGFGEWLAGSAAPDARRTARETRKDGPALHPGRRYAAEVLARDHERVRKRGRHLEQQSAGQLHRLRIAIKKLRYAGDFFSALYDRKSVKPYLVRLAELQQVLGVINDVATTQQLLATLPQSGVLQRETHGIIMGWSASTRARQLELLGPAWRDFRRAKPFW